MKNKFEVMGEITIIYLNQKTGKPLKTMIDTVDLPLVENYTGTWYADFNTKTKNYYCCGAITPEFKKKAKIKMHRYIMGATEDFVVDHINHNTLDNRRSSNLRLISNAENIQNKRSSRTDSKSGIRGVSWDKQNKKWVVQIQVDNKKKHIGYFINIAEAEQAAIEARKKYMPFSKEALAK